ncbi:hypothetical protein WN944_026232 [Citrus x changshan-huyou]|uniref:Uncharacterized protein n=1 Tax=Citrus x changshan-huyou TaxID=2935761 RepID=A0AAP0LR95_9ROSI
MESGVNRFALCDPKTRFKGHNIATNEPLPVASNVEHPSRTVSGVPRVRDGVSDGQEVTEFQQEVGGEMHKQGGAQDKGKAVPVFVMPLDSVTTLNTVNRRRRWTRASRR